MFASRSNAGFQTVQVAPDDRVRRSRKASSLESETSRECERGPFRYAGGPRPTPYARASARHSQVADAGKARNAEVVRQFIAGRRGEEDVLRSTVSHIARCGAKTGDAKACFDELQRAVNRKTGERVRANEFVYCALIASHGKVGDLSGALRWFDAMVRDAVEPKAVTWTALISAYAKAGNLPGAVACFERMRDAGIEPTVNAYGALLLAHEKVGDVEGAVRWFDRMRSEGIAPNLIIYNTLIAALGRAGDSRGAVRCFNSMRDEGIRPDEVTYNGLVAAHGKAADPQGAIRYFQKMTSDGIEPKEFAYSSLIAALENVGERDRADDYLDLGIKRGTFRRDLGHDQAGNVLDLHSHAVVVGSDEKIGICADVARAIFRRLHDQRIINRWTLFVVGSHGHNRIKDAIRDCMFEVGWLPKPQPLTNGRLNEGAWVVGDLPPEGKARSPMSARPRASPLRAFNKVMGSGTAFIG